MALFGTLVENFCGPILNTTKWDAVNSAGNSGFQEGCRYTFIVQQGATGDATLSTDVPYDLTGSHVHIELVQAGIQEAGLETYPLILTQNPANQDDALLIVVSNGFVGLYEFNGGVANLLATPAYVAADMRWWRIREAAGTVYYETAPDVRGPWTVQATVVPSIAITALHLKIRTFDFLTLATAKQTAVSNVNYLAPPDVPFPNGALGSGIEMAFGADLDGDQTTWVWTDLTPVTGTSVLMNQAISPRRGRSNEAGDVTPTQGGIRLDNPDGNLTPANPSSIYWPNVDRGTPARWWINTTTVRLYLRPVYGSSAVVQSTSSLDLTNDLDVRIDLHLKTTHPAGWNAVIVGRAVNGGPYSWRVEVLPDRRVELFWSDDGVNAQTVISDLEILPSSARATLRVTLDVDDGAGGHEVKFYIGYDGVEGSFTQIGNTFVGTGTTSINNAAADLIIGSPPEIAGLFALDADVYRFQLRDGIAGTVIVDADFTAQVSGVTSFVDSTGLVWDVEGATTELSDRHVRLYGTTDTIEPVWPWGDLSSQSAGGLGQGEARTDFEIAGILRRITQGSGPLESPLKRAILDEPTLKAYWPMEDGDQANSLASGLIGGNKSTWTGTLDLAANDDLLGSKPLITFDDSTYLTGTLTATFTNQWQVDWYVHVPSPGPTNPTSIINVFGGPGSAVFLWIVNISSAAITVIGQNFSGATITTQTASPTGFFTGWQHIRLMADQNGGNVDWQLVWFPVVYPAASGFAISASVAGLTGNLIGYTVPADDELGGISMGHLAFMDAFNLDTADNAAMGWTGDTAAQRIIRLCAEELIDFRIIGDPDGTALMGVQESATLKSLLDDARAADGGVLYEQPDSLGLIYRTRESFYNQPPNMVLDAQLNQMQNPFAPTLDDQRLRNQVTASRRNGSSYVAMDQASIDKNGLYTESVSLNLYVDTQLPDAAGWRLHQGTVEGMRYPSLVTNLGVAPEIIEQWLTCDIGAKVTVDNLPPQHPNVTVQVITEGYSEPITPVTWTPALNCSPGETWDVVVLDGEWVPDEYLLRLETDGSELDAAIDDNDTTFEVLVTAGPNWVTGASEFPFDIEVNGEQMTVSDINAESGGTQTFTVTRSVNGVVRAHPAGTSVVLWYEPVLAR